MAGFSYAHLEIVSCIRDSFSGGVFLFCYGSCEGPASSPLCSGVRELSDVEVSCCSGTIHGSGVGSVWAQHVLAGLNPFQGDLSPRSTGLPSELAVGTAGFVPLWWSHAGGVPAHLSTVHGTHLVAGAP